MESAHLSFLTNVLTHVEEFKVDWQAVATENGISRKDNCTTKFKGIMKKYGVDFSNNKFVPIEGFEGPATVPATAPSTPKTPKAKTPRKRKAGGAGGAGGDEEASDELNGLGSPRASASPKKKSKAKVRKEESGTVESLKAENDEEDEA